MFKNFSILADRFESPPSRRIKSSTLNHRFVHLPDLEQHVVFPSSLCACATISSDGGVKIIGNVSACIDGSSNSSCGRPCRGQGTTDTAYGRGVLEFGSAHYPVSARIKRERERKRVKQKDGRVRRKTTAASSRNPIDDRKEKVVARSRHHCKRRSKLQKQQVETLDKNRSNQNFQNSAFQLEF